MTDTLCPIVNELEYSTDFCIDKIKIGFTDIQPGENRQADCILQTMPVKSDRFPDVSLDPVALGGAAMFL